MRLENKTVLLCVSGGIAAYKSASLASMLVKNGADVRVILTKHAQEFIRPLTFESLTGHRCYTDLFEQDDEFKAPHIGLAQLADAIIVAPATANIIAKLSCGIADDMLTTTVLASKAPKFIAPAMNSDMYLNPVTQENLARLSSLGMEVITPDTGHLACGDEGIGKMPEPEVLYEHLLTALAHEKDMTGMHVLVSAGPTQEALDPVRFLTNHSSGKMGYCLAKECMLRGADVTLVTGKTSLTPPIHTEVVPVLSAEDMFDAVTKRSGEADLILMAAAVADYRPKKEAPEKIKKTGENQTLSLLPTKDILACLGEHKKPGQYLCGFSMETENLVENSRKKLSEKNLDMIVANNVKEEGAGFETDTNIVTLITPKGETALPLMSKEEAAGKILDQILKER